MVVRHLHPCDAIDSPMFWDPSVAFLRWAIALILGSSAAFLTILFIVAPEQMHTARGSGPVVEKRFISRTGEVVPTQLVVRSSRKANGDVDYVTAMVEDITERKLQEDLIKEHNVRLIIQKTELEVTLARIRRLEGLLSICVSCKKIRSESDTWQQLEQYLGEHSDAVFSHGLRPDCFERQKKLLD